MRDIKFRAWKESAKEMISWRDLVNDYFAMLSDVLSGVYMADVMQYTGLKDKNGVEIYEGDIVKHQQPEGGILPPAKPENCVVRYENCAFHPYIIGDNHGRKFFMMSSHLEVIGNKFENPELLESK